MSAPLLLPEPWKALAIKPGTVDKLARELCCSCLTVRRWAAGTQEPDPRAKMWIREVFKRHGMDSPI